MSDSKAKNRLIVKNTLFMYMRMLVMLFVSLFTARIVFNTLGIDNYGTYNLVAGIIIFFTFINNALGSATKRFITAEIGVGDPVKIKHIFNTCINAHIIIAIIILILGETVGLWFVNNKLNIPPELMRGANWAYQLSVVSAIIGIIQAPYGAVVVAYEKMGIYALFTIIDVILKLVIIYAVQAIDGDKLIVYSLLLLMVSVVRMIMFQTYTYFKLPICRLKFVKDVKLLKEVFTFTGWSLFGQATVVASNQGVNVLVNIFYNVAVNAAMGVSNTIINTVNGFVTNFQSAFNPQIIKSYNNGDYDYLQSLLVRGAKLSSYLIIIFLVPLLFETPRVLQLWLGDYPEYAVEFCRLSLCSIYIESIAAPLWMLIYSQSNIKEYQIVVASIYSLCFFGGWVVLYLGASPYSVIVVRGVIFFVLLFVRLHYVKRYFKEFNVTNWIYNVLIKGVIIIGISAIITGLFSSALELPNFIHIVSITIISLCCTVPLIYLFGMNKAEKMFVKEAVSKILFLKNR